MKKLLFIAAFVIIAQSVSAQLHFQTKNVKKVRQLADSIALNAKTPYVFSKEGASKRNSNYYVVIYNNPKDDYDRLGVAFHIKYIGRNIDLGTKGTPVYTFDFVQGNFLDLFPFWKRHINPNADAVKITKGTQKDKAKTQGLLYILQSTGGTWEIRHRAE